MGNRNRQAGFTLVEILIVVVILGILAAIVIPQFTSASESAKASSLSSQLQTIRSQLQLYQIQHNGEYPDLSTDWAFMTGTTDSAGAAVTADADGALGPYLQQAPANPFQSGADRFTVNQVTGSTTALPESTTVGWVYNDTTGEIKAALPDTVSGADLGLSDNDYVGGSAATTTTQ